jgi:signal transduction histidine kinase
LAADKQQQGGIAGAAAGEIDDLDELASDVLGDPRRDRAADEATLTGVAEVEASPTMLRQAIENLIDNAAAHGGPDGLEVDVRPDPAAGQVEVVVAKEAGGTAWVAPRDGGGTLVGLRVPLRPAAEPDPLNNAVNT